MDLYTAIDLQLHSQVKFIPDGVYLTWYFHAYEHLLSSFGIAFKILGDTAVFFGSFF